MIIRKDYTDYLYEGYRYARNGNKYHEMGCDFLVNLHQTLHMSGKYSTTQVPAYALEF